MADATHLCTDEQILVRAPSDYGVLRPQASRLAFGRDGVFSSGDRWTLTASSVADWAAQGVEEGHVCLLDLEEDADAYGSGGEPFVVDSVAAGGITLRRAGWAAGKGLPPGPAAGRTGVTYTVTSFAPQIESASYRVYQLFGVDDTFEARSAANLYDAREVRELCVILTLQRLCMDAWVKARDDVWKAKADSFGDEIAMTLPTLLVRWGSDGKDGPASSRRTARVSR